MPLQVRSDARLSPAKANEVFSSFEISHNTNFGEDEAFWQNFREGACLLTQGFSPGLLKAN